MSAIKYAAAAALAAALGDAVPELRDRVVVVGQPPTEPASYPAAAVLVERFRFVPQLDAELDDADGAPIMNGADALVHAGALVGSMRIWLAARLPPQRELLEEAVLRAFAGDELAPGRLSATLANVKVGDFETGVDWTIAFFVEGTEWRDELVFTERRWAFLEVEVDLPVLVLRRDAPQIQTLILQLTGDLTSSIVTPPASAPPLADLEQYDVAADGTYTPYP